MLIFPLLQTNELILLGLLKGHWVKTVFQQFLKLAPLERRLTLPVPYNSPPKISLVPNIQSSKSYPSFLRTL